MNNGILGRSLRVETNIRCDYCHRQIEKGKFATQVSGDPEEVKAQGTFHGRLCYEGALADYETKVKEEGMQEE